MEDVTRMQSVHTIRLPSLLSAHAKLDTPMLALAQLSNAMVCKEKTHWNMIENRNRSLITDSCNVNNGGCDKNAACTHDSKTFAVICTCKTGYTNVGTEGVVKCEGQSDPNILFYVH